MLMSIIPYSLTMQLLESLTRLSHNFFSYHILGSITVICAKGVSSMINLTIAGMDQMNHGLPYIMFIFMIVTAVAQVRLVLVPWLFFLSFNFSFIYSCFGRSITGGTVKKPKDLVQF